MYGRALAISLIVVFLPGMIACKNAARQETKEVVPVLKPVINYEDSLITKLTNAQYRLELNTKYLNDSLNWDDYKENPFSNPIIQKQILSFYIDDKLVKTYEMAIDTVIKETITKKKVVALVTPIYNIAYVPAKKVRYLYFVDGADYCFGVLCPEFTGIYSMSGEILFEGRTTKKYKVDLEDIMKKYGFDLPKDSASVRVELFNKK